MKRYCARIGLLIGSMTIALAGSDRAWSVAELARMVTLTLNPNCRCWYGLSN